jgi:hypothetical protein
MQVRRLIIPALVAAFSLAAPLAAMDDKQQKAATAKASTEAKKEAAADGTKDKKKRKEPPPSKLREFLKSENEKPSRYQKF